MRPPISFARFPTSVASLLAGWLALSLIPTSAEAQQHLPTLDLEHLELSADGLGSIVVESGEVLPQGGFRLSLLGDYERNLLVINQNGNQVAVPIQDRLTVNVTAAFGITNWLEIFGQLPFVPVQDGDTLTPLGFQTPSTSGLGTPVLGLRVALLRHTLGAPFDLSLGVRVGLPVGTNDAVAKDTSTSVEPELTLSNRVEGVMASISVGTLIRSSTTFTDGDEIGSQFDAGLAVSTTGRLRGEISGRAIIPFTGAKAAGEALAGIRFLANPHIELFALVGPGIGDEVGTPQVRGILGLAFVEDGNPCREGRQHTPAECPDLDDDHDGIRNSEDHCPLEKGDLAHFGCPFHDRDGDGIADDVDKCPDVAGSAAYDGCPAPDTDGDGVPDDVDKCPNVAGPADNQGCPRDRDGDGVPDDIDACPDEPGPPESRGCPIRDRDHDGVPDALDNCPDEPGPKENQGCPITNKQLVVITNEKIEIREHVLFATGKAKILEPSFHLLDQVASVIVVHPEITHIVVEGHTDNKGRHAANVKLSQQRADAVRDYLEKAGVLAELLEAKGYGPDMPADTNDTEEGRQNNRRVEFKIIWTQQQPATPGPAQ